MKTRNTYSGSFKVQVVLEYMKCEKSLLELAEEYQVHPNQIKNWKTVFMKRASGILEDKRRKDAVLLETLKSTREKSA